MVITDEIKQLIPQAPIVPIVTVSSQGQPHLITVGKAKEVQENDTLVFGIHKMEQTQRNMHDTGIMQVIIATREGGSRGFRLSGSGRVEGKQVFFEAREASALL